MKAIVTLWLLVCTATVLLAQKPTQTVRGTVLDADSKTPLMGVSVLLISGDFRLGATTDAHGNFLLKAIPLGRAVIKLQYLGYLNMSVPNIVVDAGKEVVLDLVMQESTNTLQEVTIKSAQERAGAQNEMAIVGGHTVSLEETKRYAGGFNDPARILSNFAGVTNSGNGNNEVIVRGNSPKYVQWRLEGIEITNPNHFADQNAVAGGISGLNNNLLATSEFYTGAFAPEYGDALSGVYDLKLRKGNNRKFESIIGVGILGTEITAEGPFNKKREGSFLANYRYSSLGLITKMGIVDFETGIPQFQDGAFKVVLPSQQMGQFSIWGINGWSKIVADDVNPSSFPAPGNQESDSLFRRDYEKETYFTNIGLNHTIPFGKRSFLTTSFSRSSNGIEENVFEWNRKKTPNGIGSDSVWGKRTKYDNSINHINWRGATTYNLKVNAANRFQAGVRVAYTTAEIQQVLSDTHIVADVQGRLEVWRSFISWKHAVNDALSIVSGVHATMVSDNGTYTIEPRIAASWQVTHKTRIHLGYGHHGRTEAVHHYIVEKQVGGGAKEKRNPYLDLLKAHHLVAGYEYRFTDNLRVKADAYYQYLYNLPVAKDRNSTFATLNEGTSYNYVDLVNEGKGRNAGIELTVERFFHHNYYFLLNGTVFYSAYKALDGVWRSTAFDDRYLTNILVGKEFVNLGRKDNQTIGLNATVFYGGGKTYVPLYRNAVGVAGVNPLTGDYEDKDKAYSKRLDAVFRLTISASYKWNRNKTTHELFINLDNITNNTSRLSEYYDSAQNNNIAFTKQVGFFPNIMYRIYL